MMNRLLLLFVLFPLLPTVAATAQGFGFGPQAGGRGRGPDERHAEDRRVFHFLLSNHNVIEREVTELADGVLTVTRSEDPEVAEKLKEHVRWMHHRIKENKPIRRRDPLFDELFRHTDKIEMEIKEIPDGVRVTETSDDPYVARLIQAHAAAVSKFVAEGFAEARKNHAVPSREREVPSSPQNSSFRYHHPKIEKYGPVVRLPEAAQQPRPDSQICVDLTRSDEPDKLNPAIEKVARFVNIYHGAGKEPAGVRLAIILHGDATLDVLDEEAYRKRFGTEGNPNLDCLQKLHRAGVEIYVCGQSLVGKGATPEQVVEFADVAVSALTALVNLQTDGYAYVPLLQ